MPFPLDQGITLSFGLTFVTNTIISKLLSADFIRKSTGSKTINSAYFYVYPALFEIFEV